MLIFFLLLSGFCFPAQTYYKPFNWLWIFLKKKFIAHLLDTEDSSYWTHTAKSGELGVSFALVAPSKG